MPDGKKKAPGEERGIFGRGELGCVCMYVRMYMQRCGSVYVTRFFSRYVSPFFSLLTQIKKNPKLFIPHVFLYRSLFINCYFLEITNTHVSCTTIIEQHRRHK